METPHVHMTMAEMVEKGRLQGIAMMENVCATADRDCLLQEGMNVLQIACCNALACMAFNAQHNGLTEAAALERIINGIKTELNFMNIEASAGNVKEIMAGGQGVQ